MASDSEAPESWLQWRGWRKLLLGYNAHRRWRYAGPAGPPSRYVRWHVRSSGEAAMETAANLGRSAAAALTCSEPRWAVEAHAAAEEADTDAHDGASSLGSARGTARTKRALVSVGVVATYITWALFCWCVLRPTSGVAGAECIHAAGSSSRTARWWCSCWARERRSPSRAPGASATE